MVWGDAKTLSPESQKALSKVLPNTRSYFRNNSMNICSLLSALKLEAAEKKHQSIHPSLQKNGNGKAILNNGQV